MNYALLGYMGSGKSTIGKALSEVLGIPFFDLDQTIESLEGCSISDLFAAKGEIYFRKREAEVLFDLLERGPKVIATGGGTPCYGVVMDRLLQHSGTKTIYLKHPVDELADRLYPERAHRPLIAHLDAKEELNEFVRKHLFERGFYYNKAEWIVECSGLNPVQIVEQIVLRLF